MARLCEETNSLFSGLETLYEAFELWCLNQIQATLVVMTKKYYFATAHQ